MEIRKDNLGKIGPREIVLITVVRNEVDILPAFINHYTNLGIRKFIIVDNDSDDGSSDNLDQLDGTALYRTSESYRDSIAGINWVNRLADRHCVNRWVLVVDADEFLILPPGLDTIQQLRSKLESQLDMGLFCPMVDLFPEHVLDAARPSYATFDELAAAAPMFTPFRNQHLTQIDQYPYLEYRKKGGFRGALTGTKKPSARLGKIPFVFWREGYRFMKSTHVGSPLPLSFETGVLAHFKFRPGFQDRMAREQTNRDRLDPTALSMFLNASLKTWPRNVVKNAHRYTKNDDFIAAGFLAPSVDVSESLPVRWQKSNKTKTLFFKQLAGDHAAQDAHDVIANQQLEALLNAKATRLTRRFRTWLYRHQLLRAHYVPELIELPAARIESMAIFYKSYWWDVGIPFRLIRHVRKAIIWRNLFRARTGRQKRSSARREGQ